VKYQISHTTTYQYEEAVPVCHNQVILAPRASSRVNCLQHRLLVQPQPRFVLRRNDYYGNHVHSFSIEDKHDRLRVTSLSRVEVTDQMLPEVHETPAWEELVPAQARREHAHWFEACPFLFDSPRITRSRRFADYARDKFSPGRSMLDATLELTRQIHEDIRYDREATETETSADEVFRLRRGVCQDLAHVQIACLRSLGLAARYVSGYLRTNPPEGQPPRVGADQSHAWVGVHCGSWGWIDFDPTNSCPCNSDHIPIAWGRDYSDVVPIRGVFLGGGAHDLRVAVEVLPI
jgi:transglutaminase-like putative cysteine protease